LSGLIICFHGCDSETGECEHSGEDC
jgi:hypothetical protein